ncbi:hypothetical protein K504DRAFT_462651 [Pleomassaria siparia CBS 279.74]|uniref:F-box domain-containing protein n=1 Tax=Pleomassaria siparia CBS 279.74 TaxID=1314801 RepID=A0A6G1KNK9_9PLEO|nr:hypothetical protein K504DRAFT_462651 [Pleomassaria siparia CBS 279.74]
MARAGKKARAPPQSKKRVRDQGEEEAQAPATAPAKRLRKEDIFPFLELPAELQNRIYELAIEITASSWPVIRDSKAEKRERKRASKSSSSSDSASESPALPRLPFLGLTQTCTKIRVEFRGWWMENHRIPLCTLDRYLSTFYPLPPLKNRHRFQAYVKTAGQLKVWLRQSEFENKDILRLLKLKVRLPNYTIIFQHGFDVKASEARGLSELINNKNPVWLRWIRSRIITQVRTTTGRRRNDLDIVVRAQHAPAWMHALVPYAEPRPETSRLAKELGIDQLSHWTPRFAVCY